MCDTLPVAGDDAHSNSSSDRTTPAGDPRKAADDGATATPERKTRRPRGVHTGEAGPPAPAQTLGAPPDPDHRRRTRTAHRDRRNRDVAPGVALNDSELWGFGSPRPACGSRSARREPRGTRLRQRRNPRREGGSVRRELVKYARNTSSFPPSARRPRRPPQTIRITAIRNEPCTRPSGRPLARNARSPVARPGRPAYRLYANDP
jgi:hypothetical protein